MKSVLANVKKVDVYADPFPHIVITDPLDDDVCSQLIAEYPDLKTITNGADYGSNLRFSYSAKEVLKNGVVSPLWQEFVRLHTSDAFLQEVIHLFDDQIRATYPWLERKIGRLDTLKAGVRKIDNFSTADVLLDAQICVNTPVVSTPNSVRRAHVDRSDKLFAGLFYLRHPEDDSTGGDLEIYKFKERRDRFKGEYIDEAHVEVVKTVKYQRNVLVLFVNSIASVHGVTVRSQTKAPRYFFNLVGEVNQQLFDLTDYQERSWLGRSAPAKALRSLKKLALTK
jgi:hypothetical protein